jgi:hypothetical protein
MTLLSIRATFVAGVSDFGLSRLRCDGPERIGIGIGVGISGHTISYLLGKSFFESKYVLCQATGIGCGEGAYLRSSCLATLIVEKPAAISATPRPSDEDVLGSVILYFRMSIRCS